VVRGSNRPSALADPARVVAYRLLRAVDEDGAYANLALPGLIAAEGLRGRDAALATELGYGTLRARGTLDEIVGACTDRPLADVQPAVRDVLRLGAYQALRTRIPPHAAVATAVDLARGTGSGRAAGFVNAVLRRVSRSTWDEWIARLGADASPLRQLALRTAHPEWIAAAFVDALGGSRDEAALALAADDERPSRGRAAATAPNWAARPGRGRRTRCGCPAAIRPRSPRCARDAPASRTRAASCARSRSPTLRSAGGTSGGWTCVPDPAARPRCSPPWPRHGARP
jgi:transcription termination factor NusB